MPVNRSIEPGDAIFVGMPHAVCKFTDRIFFAFWPRIDRAIEVETRNEEMGRGMIALQFRRPGRRIRGRPRLPRRYIVDDSGKYAISHDGDVATIFALPLDCGK